MAGTPGPLRAVWLGTVAYAGAREMQRRLAELRRRGAVDDCVLLLEHPPVYTLGRGVAPAHLRGGADALRALGAACVEVDRGGSVTFHGPGQLVAYPIVDLGAALPVAGHGGAGDVHAYLRLLEDALCATARRLGVDAVPRPPYTGAWVGRSKLAAIGVKLAHGGVTQHGVALNVRTDLRWFEAIVPCGIPAEDGDVTSLERLGVTGHTVAEVGALFAAELAAGLGRTLLGGEPVVRLLSEAVPARAPA